MINNQTSAQEIYYQQFIKRMDQESQKKDNAVCQLNLKSKFGRKLMFTLADFMDRFGDHFFTLADSELALGFFCLRFGTPMFTISAWMFTASV